MKQQENWRPIQRLAEARQAFRETCLQDVPGVLAARTHAETVHSILREAFQGEDLPPSKWALAAIGGFGRGELSFLSDLDLLVIHQDRLPRPLREAVQKLVYGLWDADFDVGHLIGSVSSVKRLVKEDFSVLTSHMEARFIAGDEDFFRRWRDGFIHSRGARHQKRLYQDLARYRAERLHRYGETAYLLEPHVKEGGGGLRDLHTLRWAATACLGDPSPEAMVREGWLREEEKLWLEQARDFLWRVRLQLHALNGRRQDQLLFSEQEKLCGRLGFMDGEQVSAVEAFMHHYYRHTARVRRTTGFIFDVLEERYGHKGPVRYKWGRKRILPGPLLLEGRHIRFLQPELIPEDPRSLMGIFWQAIRSGAYFHHETGRIIRENLRYFQDSARQDPQVVQQFFDILLDPEHAFSSLNTMMETGLLQTFMPEFALVRYRAQYDVYHLYTVDEHLLRTVQELHRLERESDDPLISDIFVHIENRAVLFLAALLHDVGKRQGTSHSIRGAELARDIAGRLKLAPTKTELLCFLVENHLLLPETALKRDLSDEKPLVQCSIQVGSRERLRLLYLLAIADSRATGPGVWNTWRSALLKELFLKVDGILFRGDWKGEDVQRRREEVREEVLTLARGDFDPAPLSLWLDGLSSRYLLSQEPEDILAHYGMELTLTRTPLAFDAKPYEGEMWRITLATADRHGLFSLITGVLWAHGLNILGADIYTRRSGIALDILVVERLLDPLHSREALKRIREDLAAVLQDRSRLPEILRGKRRSPLLQPKALPRREDRVIIYEEASDRFTVLEVYTWDRPGVLFVVSDTLYRLGISIRLAKISTPGAQVADVFYVTDEKGAKLMEPEMHRQVEKGLLEALAGLQ